MVTVNASREAIQAEIEKIEKNVTLAAESLFGITPHSLQIAAITPSANFMKSIDEATMAKNSAIAAENQLRTKQFEAQQVAATAKGKADATIEEARGQAESTRLNANAQAAARIATATAEAQVIEMTGLATAKSLRAQSEAVKGSPDLVEWTKATKWNGALPTALYSGAPIPFMNVASPK
jgi:regulator of protease activity HflC (stomatin/prohibitin superfamily)